MLLTMTLDQYKERSQLLREVVEALMWELNAIRTSQWDQLLEFTQKKQVLAEKMKAFDWASSAQDLAQDQLEYLSLKSQIVDLEVQIQKSLEVNMETVKLQMQDLQQRHNRWKAAVAPYLQQ